MNLLQQQNYAQAAVELKNALKQKADMAPAWLALAEIEERDRNWENVAKYLHKTIELDPKNLDARIRLARLALLVGDYDEALKLANAAEEIDQRNASVKALKAIVLFKLNETGSAVTEAQNALDIDPLNSEALIVLAA